MITHQDIRLEHPDLPPQLIKAIPWLRAGMNPHSCTSEGSTSNSRACDLDKTTCHSLSRHARLSDRAAVTDLVKRRAAIHPPSLASFDAETIAELEAEHDRTWKVHLVSTSRAPRLLGLLTNRLGYYR